MKVSHGLGVNIVSDIVDFDNLETYKLFQYSTNNNTRGYMLLRKRKDVFISDLEESSKDSNFQSGSELSPEIMKLISSGQENFAEMGGDILDWENTQIDIETEELRVNELKKRDIYNQILNSSKQETQSSMDPVFENELDFNFEPTLDFDDFKEDINQDGSSEDDLFDDSLFDGNTIDELDFESLDEVDVHEQEFDDKLYLDEEKSERGLIDVIIPESKRKLIQEGTSEKYLTDSYEVIYLYKTEQIKDIKDPLMKKYTNIKNYRYGNIREFNRIQRLIEKVYKVDSEEYSESFQMEYNHPTYKKSVTRRDYLGKTKYKEFREMITNNLLGSHLEDDDCQIDIFRFKANKYIKNRIEEVIEKLNVKFEIEVYSSLTDDEKKLIRKEEGLAVSFPRVSYFKTFLNLGYVENSDYRIIDDEEGLIWLKEQIDNLPPDHVIAYDAETTGLLFRYWLKDTEKADELVTHSFSWKDHQSVIIPVRMKNRKNITLEQNEKYIKPILENRRILAHNGSADLLFNKYDNIELNVCEDTFILIKHLMPYLSYDEETGKSKSRSSLTRELKVLLNRMFNEDKIDLNKYVFKPLGLPFDFSILPDEYLIYYGCPDTDALRRLWKALIVKLDKSQYNAYREMTKYSCTMANLATWAGIKLSKDIMIEGRRRDKELMDSLEELILKLAGETKETLMISSPQQLANFIYGKMGVPVTDKTKRTAKNTLAVDKEVLKNLFDEKASVKSDIFKEDILRHGEVFIKKDDLNSSKYPICGLILGWKNIYKDITAYFDGLMNVAIDDIYYENFKVGSTDTWRTTGRVQITKNTLKDGLIPYSEDWGVCCMDFSAQELRIATNISGDLELASVLSSPEADPHKSAAASLFDKKRYEVTYQERKQGKTCNFLILYGGKARRLAQNLFGKNNPSMDELEYAQTIHKKYEYTYSMLIKALKAYRTKAVRDGWVQNSFGFRMIYDTFLDLEDYERQIFDPERKEPPVVNLDLTLKEKLAFKVANAAGNFPIQSYAAALLMILSNRLWEEIKKRGYENRIFLPITVHDEINLIYHKSISPFEVMDLIKSVFEVHYKGEGKVPLFVGIGFGDSWGEAKSDSRELPVRLQNIILEEFKSGMYDKTVTVKNAPSYFLKRKEDYIRERIQKALDFVYESKIYNTGVVEKTLRDDIFILSEGAAFFGIYNEKTTIYNHKKIMDIILSRGDILLEDIQVIEEPIKEEEKKDETVDFIFHNNLPEIISANLNTVVVDVTGLDVNKFKKVMEYLSQFYSKSSKAKKVVIKNGKTLKTVDNLTIRGLPLTARADMENIIKGYKVKNYITEVGTGLSVSDVLFKKGEYLVLDQSSIQDELSKDIQARISKYLIKESGEGLKLVIKKGDDAKAILTEFILPAQIPFSVLEKEVSLVLKGGVTVD